MSHVVDIQFVMTDLDVLAAAAKRLGGELIRGESRWRWWGRHEGDYPLPKGFTVKDMGRNADHIIRFEGCGWDVGVYKCRDGREGYTVLFDFYAGGRGLVDRIGEGAGKLKQAYATVKAKKELFLQGVTNVEERKLPDGKIELAYEV